MQKTSNYNLNQWEATDPIRREDFNADNAAIDAAIKAVEQRAGAAWSPDNLPWEIGTIDLSEISPGGTVKTFDFTPTMIILFSVTATIGATINGLAARMDYISSSESGTLLCTLRGNNLTTNGFTGTLPDEIHYLALK